LDFDIIGSNSSLADIEILNVAAQIFLKLGATENDFVIYINSRELMNKQLVSYGLSPEQCQKVLSAIDKKDKVSDEAFTDMLQKAGLTEEQVSDVAGFLADPSKYVKQFDSLLEMAKNYGIEKYIKVNPTIVRGLDYYTGLVFEVKSKGTLGRSVLGGGRYDNLVGMFDQQLSIPGIGFATSDTIMLEFLKEIGKTPTVPRTQTQVLITVFDETVSESSMKIASHLRSGGVAVELYPDFSKLPKQLKYANRCEIPYVIVIGPEEDAKQSLLLKDMQTGDQVEIQQSQIVSHLTTLLS
jgi:histidyl-tRNA synthetase